MEFFVRVLGGMCFGFTCSRLINPYRERLGGWQDVVGLSIALGATSLWMWLCTLIPGVV